MFKTNTKMSLKMMEARKNRENDKKTFQSKHTSSTKSLMTKEAETAKEQLLVKNG